jgi:hypothetical protein
MPNYLMECTRAQLEGERITEIDELKKHMKKKEGSKIQRSNNQRKKQI